MDPEVPKTAARRRGVIDVLRETFSDPSGPGDLIRYGTTPQQKYRMTVNREIPGMPDPFLPSGEENPEATRYASQYLGARDGFLPDLAVLAGNELAIREVLKPRDTMDPVKVSGQRGFDQGVADRSILMRLLKGR
jgi:hypothetical protein